MNGIFLLGFSGSLAATCRIEFRNLQGKLLIFILQSLAILTIYNIDPLCYADDVSVLLLESKNSRELNMIWNPRMEDVREPSILVYLFWKDCGETLQNDSLQNRHQKSICS